MKKVYLAAQSNHCSEITLCYKMKPQNFGRNRQVVYKLGLTVHDNYDGMGEERKMVEQIFINIFASFSLGVILTFAQKKIDQSFFLTEFFLFF